MAPKQLASIHYNQTQGVNKIKEAVLYHDQAYPRGATVGGSRGAGWVVRYQLKSGCFAVTEQPDEPRGGWRRGRPYCEKTIGNVCVS